jgi:hypothetical protein
MKHRFGSRAALCLIFTGITLGPAPAVLAQHEAGTAPGPSKYLFLENVVLKPSMDFPYLKAEGDEIQAERSAKAPGRYIGMWGITGSGHVLYMHGFDAYADLQKDHEATFAMPTLMEAMKTNSAAQAGSIATDHSSIYTYEKDLSLAPNLDLSKMRFMRIILFHVKTGHDDEFRHLAKLFVKGYQATLPDAHWAMFEKSYGEGSDNTYILVTPMESLTDVDKMVGGDKKFTDGVGEDQLAVIFKGLDAAVESHEADLFAFDPQLSYVPDSWLTSSPDFWGKK